MRKMISGLIAAAAVMTAGIVPALACGWAGPCVQAPYLPATTYVPTVTVVPTVGYIGCGTCWGGWAGWGYERLAEPTRQYYYVNQGPTYSGPGAFAPFPTYHEDALPYYGSYRWRHHYHYRPWQ